MNKQKRVILGIILLIVIFMGIGYAVISNVTLTINGRASATANSDNFKVYFTAQNTKGDAETTVTAESITATVNFNGLSSKGDSKYAILEIQNGSTDIVAGPVTVEVASTKPEVFKPTAVICDQDGTEVTNTELEVGAKTYVKVSTELLKTIVGEDETGTITATITATPKVN